MAADSKYPASVKAGKPILEKLPVGWDRKTLDHYIELTPRKAMLKDDVEYDLVKVKRSRGGVVRREHLLGRNISVKSQFFLEEGDFLISKRQIVHGACGFVPNELDGSIVSNEYSVFKAKPNFYLSYLKYLSETLYFQQTCFHSSIGVHIEKMIFKLDSWFKWNFNIPPIAEQMRISKILSAWDKAITTTEQLLVNSQQHKKSLMQQLLTGKKRLPGYSNDWKRETLSEIADIVMGSSPKSENYNNQEEGLPLLQGNADIKNRLSSPRIYTSQVTKECLVNDILLSVRAPVGEVARSNHHACIGRGIAAIRAKNDVVQNYLYQWLLYFEPKWAKLSQGSTFEAVNSNDIKTLYVEFPSKEEQQKIASVLLAADHGIIILQQKLQCLCLEKKALMQQLLTGKRRVIA